MYVKDNADDNKSTKLVKEIAHIRFSALTVLNFEGNGVNSIEALSSAAMPHMRRLNLGTRLTT